MSLKTLAARLRPAAHQAAGTKDCNFRSANRSHVGKVRAVNEDRVLDMPDRRLWAIVDGMGGHAAGDVAAEAAAAALQAIALQDRISAKEIEAALGTVNQQLFDRTRQGAPMSGATIAAMFAQDHTITILWAGDCRAYRLRDGQLAQLTRDHSLVQDLLDSGAIDAVQAAHHPHRNVVTRALGAAETLILDQVMSDVQGGDIFLLCSDGLTMIRRELEITMKRVPKDLEATVKLLVDDALRSGGHDNISAILVAVTPERC